MAIASRRSAALIYGLVAANLVWVATGLQAAERASENVSTPSFTFISDEATAPVATSRLSSRTSLPKSLQKSLNSNPVRGRSASFRTDSTVTVVKNQNTTRKTIFGLNTRNRKIESSPSKERKGLFSSWGGGSKLGFFKKGEKKPEADIRAKGSLISVADKPSTSSNVVANKVPNRVAVKTMNSSPGKIIDPNIRPAAYHGTSQRGGQFQMRSTNATNRPTLFGKLSKSSKPTSQRSQKRRLQTQLSQNQSTQNKGAPKQRTQKLAPKQNATTAALKSRRNSTNSVPNPLNNMFRRRGANRGANKGLANSGLPAIQPISSQSNAKSRTVQTRNQNRNLGLGQNRNATAQLSTKQLTKSTPTRKPTRPSPINARQQRSTGLALRQATPLRTKATGPNPLAKRSLTAMPLMPTPKNTNSNYRQPQNNRPQGMSMKVENGQPIATTKPAPLTPAQRHVSKLIVEIHEKAETATTSDEYTYILTSCRRALAVEPKGELADYSKKLAAWALNRRGQLRVDGGDDQHAMLDFEDALRLDSNQWRALHNRAVLRAQAGDFEQAFDDFNRCTELNPRFAKAYSNRGALFVQAGDLLAALQDYRRAIQLDPELAVAHKGRGRVCHMLGSLDESLYHFDAAMLLDPDNAHVVASRADLLADTGRYSQAASEYRRAIQMDENMNHALRSAAWLLATCPDESVRNPADAMMFALKAIDLDHRVNIISLDTLAAAQANAGDYSAAIATMARVLAMSSEKELSTYKYRLELYTDSQPFRIQPVSAVQSASYTE